MERDTEKEVTPSIGPIHPNTREAEFKNLKRGSYSIFLEIHVRNHWLLLWMCVLIASFICKWLFQVKLMESCDNLLEFFFHNYYFCSTVIQYWWCGVLGAASCGPCSCPRPAPGNCHRGWSGWTQSSREADMWSSQQERQVRALFIFIFKLDLQLN